MGMEIDFNITELVDELTSDGYFERAIEEKIDERVSETVDIDDIGTEIRCLQSEIDGLRDEVHESFADRSVNDSIELASSAEVARLTERVAALEVIIEQATGVIRGLVNLSQR